jgi:hypothetical protein
LIKDKTDQYAISIPEDQPLVFSRGGFYRLKAKAECRVCGRKFPITLRVARFTRGGTPGKVAFPDPSDERVVSSMLLAAMNHGCGCANRKNFTRLLEANFGTTVKVKGPLCLHGPAETCGLCKEAFQPNPRLKWAPHLHTKTCPVGQMERHADFILQATEARKMLVLPRGTLQ